MLDTAGKTVWRIDLAKKAATPVLKAGQRASGTRVGDPKLIAVGGPDVLILDAKNTLWRWRPAGNTGKGTLARVTVKDSASWGDDIKGIGTFVANFDAGFYNLYVVDPSEQNIMVYDAGQRRVRLPAAPDWAAAHRPHVVDGIDRSHDRRRHLRRRERRGRARHPGHGLDAGPAGATPSSGRQRLHDAVVADPAGWHPSRRIGRPVRLRRRATTGSWPSTRRTASTSSQYQLAGGDEAGRTSRASYVLPGADADAPSTMWWISSNGLNSALLEAAPEESPSASPSAEAPPKAAPAKTPKPTTAAALTDRSP